MDQSIWEMSVDLVLRKFSKVVVWFTAATCLVIVPSTGMAGAQAHKVDMCHKAHDISVSKKAVRAHLAHGDSLGRCNSCTGACSSIFNPVACTNGQIYANACLAECAGQTQCGPRCACANTFDPVSCGDGKTYVNACVAQCNGQTQCGSNCACDLSYEPVTCSNGQTYINQCLATCTGASGCAGLCACDNTFSPVRCADGRTYANACLAGCAGQTNCTAGCREDGNQGDQGNQGNQGNHGGDD